jgi:hypothetical protein
MTDIYSGTIGYWLAKVRSKPCDDKTVSAFDNVVNKIDAKDIFKEY